MPRYFFHVYDGEKATIDEEGIELPDEAAVREEALVAARELMSDGMLTGKDRTAWRVEVCTMTACPLLMIPFSEAIRESGG